MPHTVDIYKELDATLMSLIISIFSILFHTLYTLYQSFPFTVFKLVITHSYSNNFNFVQNILKTKMYPNGELTVKN